MVELLLLLLLLLLFDTLKEGSLEFYIICYMDILNNDKNVSSQEPKQTAKLPMKNYNLSTTEKRPRRHWRRPGDCMRKF